MRWDYYINKYVHNYCMVRGLSSSSLKTYEIDLNHFATYVQVKKKRKDPKDVKISDIFDYFTYLKDERGNSQSTVFKQSGIIKKFYQGMVSLGHIDFYENPMRDFRRVKPGPNRFRDILTRKEAKRLMKVPNEETILGIRDKAIILLLYTTGIRASECCNLKVKDIDLEGLQIKVMGKGQKERIVPLNKQTAKYLKKYQTVRGEIARKSSFFKTRLGTGITRKGIYDRIKKHVRLAGIKKVISPHNFRHSFATDLISQKVSIVTVQKLLGHSSIESTMRYLRITIQDMREAIDKHPVNDFNEVLNRLLPNVRLPYQLSRSGFK